MKADESGASLVLALVFVLAVALLLVAIVQLSGTNLLDTADLQNLRSLEYSADATVDSAIQAARYQSPVPTTLCSPTTGFSVGAVNQGASIVAFCQSSTVLTFRQVQFWACSTSQSCPSANSSGVVISATVDYGDSPNVGSTVTVLNWTVHAANH